MDSEQQQPPLPGRQPGYEGWQYDQGPAGPAQGQPYQSQNPLIPPPQVPGSPLPPQGNGNVPPYPPQPGGGNMPPQSRPLPPRYQEPIADMGTSLGYGQGMEYQYFDVPQPSQPMPRLRMERLQQLRQERARRKQQHNPDLTAFIRRRREGKNAPIGALRPSGQASPSLMPPPPITPPPPVAPGAVGAVAAPPLPSNEPAQNTAAIQKVRVGRAALILSGAFIASRVLGLLRQGIFSYIFGASGISDAYVQAFLVPDTVFQIVSGGALASAFIPIFTKYMVTEDDESTAWHIANTALTVFTAAMVVIALVAMIFAGPIVKFYYTGGTPYKIELTTGLMRIMLLQSIALGSGVIINSVLQARQNFMLPAIGTVVYNVGVILGLVPGLFGHFDTHNPNSYTWAIQGAAWGVVLGAILQVGVQVAGLKGVGMRYRPSFDWRNPAVLQIMKQMVPRVFNASMLSLTTFVDRFMITGVLGVALVGSAADGLVTQYFNAYQLVMLPLGIIGMAMSTAAFPTLAEYVSRGRMERVQTILLETLRSILFLSIPASLGLIILGLPLIQALLEHGAFTLDAANATAVSLGFYAIGLAGMSAVEICTRAFYALRDSRTPVIVSISQFVVKIALGLIMVNIFFSIGSSIVKGTPAEVALNGAVWGMGSLALATAVSSIGEAVVLFLLLHQRIGGLLQRSLLTFITRVLIATGAMGVALLAVRLVLDVIINTTNPGAPLFIDTGPLAIVVRILKLSIEMFVGLIVFLRAAKMLSLEELGPFRRVLDRFKLSWLM